MIPIHDENRPSRKPIINYALIIINVALFFFFLLDGGINAGIRLFGVIPSLILGGDRLWTLLTSMFLHANIMHLAGNMLYLWIFGDNVEDAFGHGRYLMFYLAGGVFASIMHILSALLSIIFNPIPYVILGLHVPCVGASGAISAVLGAYMLLFPGARIRTLVFLFYFVTVISVPAFFYLGFWFLYQLMMGFVSLLGVPSTVAFWAHIGGFLFGMFAVKAFGVKPKARRPRPARRPIVSPWTRTPLVDVIVEDEIVRVYAFMPGVRLADIELTVHEWEVIISAQREAIRYYGRISLPVPVIPRAENINYINGTLSFILYRAYSQTDILDF